MSRAALRALYPAASTAPLIDGRDPATGKRVIAGGDELVPSICEVAGVPVNATACFEDDALVEIDLWPERFSEEQLLLVVRRLARGFGRESLVEIPVEERWVWGDIIVILRNENGFRFELIRR
jgi:hypothetical protein